MINVGVIGHTGRLGIPLVEILNRHPYAEIVYTESPSKGVKGDLSEVECFFLATPPGGTEEHLHKWMGKRVIDLSPDHRGIPYPDWVDGFPELNKEKIANADYVANPGCYATSIVPALYPIKDKVSQVCISSISGISGAGMESHKKDNIEAYDVLIHRQIQEMEDVLGLEGILFVPIKDYKTGRGIVSIIFANYDKDIDEINPFKELRRFYSSSDFVIVTTNTLNPQNIKTENVNGTNICEIKIWEDRDRVIIISALDNLIKGGAGQAVQNFNIMYGFDETTGLKR